MARKHKIRETPHDTKSRTYRLVAHYLSIGINPETVAKVMGVDVDYVRGVAEYESRYRV
jgi:hypothetical protein